MGAFSFLLIYLFIVCLQTIFVTFSMRSSKKDSYLKKNFKKTIAILKVCTEVEALILSFTIKPFRTFLLNARQTIQSVFIPELKNKMRGLQDLLLFFCTFGVDLKYTYILNIEHCTYYSWLLTQNHQLLGCLKHSCGIIFWSHYCGTTWNSLKFYLLAILTQNNYCWGGFRRSWFSKACVEMRSLYSHWQGHFKRKKKCATFLNIQFHYLLEHANHVKGRRDLVVASGSMPIAWRFW